MDVTKFKVAVPLCEDQCLDAPILWNEPHPMGIRFKTSKVKAKPLKIEARGGYPMGPWAQNIAKMESGLRKNRKKG